MIDLVLPCESSRRSRNLSITLNCFVIMPFSDEFDDVYTIIKSSIESAFRDEGCRCFRLDESRPAGRITDRLLFELKSASICVADLTGARPNVMWEVGFAMALTCPVILVTQELEKLPFDIRDMQTIEYSRNRLRATLGEPLERCVRDTLASIETKPTSPTPQGEIISQLQSDVAELKGHIEEIISAKPITKPELNAFSSLEGAWKNTISHSHAYGKVINGALFWVYCFLGDDSLTGVYSDWRFLGQHWFARYEWTAHTFSGITILAPEGSNILKGSWWSSGRVVSDDLHPELDGVPTTWEKVENKEVPPWAEEGFKVIGVQGLSVLLHPQDDG